MKSNSWKKEWLVVLHSDYDNTWSVRTIPCTFQQAIRFVRAKHLDHGMTKGTVKLVTLKEWADIEAAQQPITQ